jgi:cyclic beta-1,2-glucan synthetase
MFEYLMPLLLTRSYDGTLLDLAARNAVRLQISYGKARGVAWGISESAFALVDRQGHYQYKAFGTPGLGLKRGLGDDLVIAPYATMLALMVDPEPSLKNLRRLRGEGLEGRYGMYEAVDYTTKPYGTPEQAETPPDDQRSHVVTAFLAHHQGMSLLALDNVLLEGAMQRRFHADPRVQATEVLLQERLARNVSIMRPRPIEARPAVSPAIPSSVRRFRTPHTPYPQAQFLSTATRSS